MQLQVFVVFFVCLLVTLGFLSSGHALTSHSTFDATLRRNFRSTKKRSGSAANRSGFPPVIPMLMIADMANSTGGIFGKVVVAVAGLCPG